MKQPTLTRCATCVQVAQRPSPTWRPRPESRARERAPRLLEPSDQFFRNVVDTLIEAVHRRVDEDLADAGLLQRAHPIYYFVALTHDGRGLNGLRRHELALLRRDKSAMSQVNVKIPILGR